MPLIVGANSVSGYNVANSLRFNSGSSDSLTKTTTTPDNRDKLTLSAWFKLSSGSTSQEIFGFYGSNDYFTVRAANASQIDVILYDGGTIGRLITTQLLRDFSAWYHIVVVVDSANATADDRMKIYLNGNQITSFSSRTNPSQNQDFILSTLTTTGIGINTDQVGSVSRFNGYISEAIYVDNQALTPSSFGETDTLTGIWKPKAYTGTYGTAGFELEFKNSASLGADSSGNGNNFTVNNLTSLDQTTDTPTNNWCTLNAVDNIATSGSGTLTQGNTNVSYTGGAFNTNATIAVNKGKWYWETKAVANTRQGFIGMRIGFQEIPNTYSEANTLENASFSLNAQPTAGVYSYVNGSGVSRGAALTYNDGDIIGIALDLDNNISYWYLNGSLSVTYNFSALSAVGTKNLVPAVGNGSGTANPELNVNFGNPSITIVSGNADANGYGNFEYTVPAGYYALNTKNLAEYA